MLVGWSKSTTVHQHPRVRELLVLGGGATSHRSLLSGERHPRGWVRPELAGSTAGASLGPRWRSGVAVSPSRREPTSSNKAGGELLVRRPGDRVSHVVTGGRAGGNGESNSQASLVCVAVTERPPTSIDTLEGRL